jgi:hypothetical protein
MKMKTKKSVIVLLFLSCAFFLFACDSGNSGSGDNGAVAGAGSAASGIFTINTSGADGGPDGGSGGDGGYVDIQMYYGSMGPLQVMASGAAVASFTPTASTPNLGNNPLAITADTTITVEGAEPVAGTPYLVAASSILRISDGNGTLSDEAAVTGISVAAGTTLTLELNNTPNAQVDLSNDIDNDGTITTVDVDATQRGNPQLNFNSYHGNSAIDTSGTLDGQSGGYVEMNPSYSFFNNGSINTSGADSTVVDAGDGGYVQIYASYGIENTGNITTDGGAASGAGTTGGTAGYLDWQADLSLYNSGNLSCRGGEGVSAGGDSNWIYLFAGSSYPGDLYNSGDLDTSGGEATAGDGGFGSSIDMYAYGGDIINSGNLTTKGGDTTDPDSNGGYVEMETDIYYGVYYPDIDKVVNSGNIDTSGGDSLEVTSSPGNANYVWIWGYNGVTNSGNIAAGGGDNLGTDGPLLTGYGNDAEAVELYAELGPVSNSGDLTTDGGDGEDGGGNANVIGLFGPEVSNSGPLAANGGDADPSVVGSTGGDGDVVELFSPGGMQGITQTGTVTNDGGTGATQGTDGDYYLGGQLL